MSVDELSIARTGLARAVPGTHSPDEIEAAIATGQALFWAIALDEVLKHDSDYRATRENDAHGKLLQGLRPARNAAAHGAVVGVWQPNGFVFPMTFPTHTRELRWANYSVIRAGLDRDPRVDERETYESLLSGRSVFATMTGVEAWFARCLDSTSGDTDGADSA